MKNVDLLEKKTKWQFIFKTKTLQYFSKIELNYFRIVTFLRLPLIVPKSLKNSFP